MKSVALWPDSGRRIFTTRPICYSAARIVGHKKHTATGAGRFGSAPVVEL